MQVAASVFDGSIPQTTAIVGWYAPHENNWSDFAMLTEVDSSG
jgi:hypothetical protein